MQNRRSLYPLPTPVSALRRLCAGARLPHLRRLFDPILVTVYAADGSVISEEIPDPWGEEDADI